MVCIADIFIDVPHFYICEEYTILVIISVQLHIRHNNDFDNAAAAAAAAYSNADKF